jgi:signal transduction histidine kinase
MALASRRSVKWKLILASILGSGTALLIVGAVIAGFDLVGLRQKLVRRLSIQTDIVGTNCLSALLFSDPKSAEATLAALKADPRIRAAGLYTADRRLFATYVRDPGSETILPTEGPRSADPIYDATGNRLLLSRSILFDGKTIGAVVIISDLDEIAATMARDVLIFASVLLVSLLISLAISTRLQRAIAQPILELAETARKVTQEKDYSVRATGASGDEIGTLVVAFNEMLEEIRQQETELRSARDRLEQRVAERTAQLESANKELEAFSYSVSHDLRAPLRSIEGFSNALMEDCSDSLNEAGKDSLQRIVGSTVRMGQLIDGLLNLSRVARTEMRGRSVDLSSLAREIVADLREGENGRQVECVIAEGAVAEGDPALLRAVLQNLIGNAWKFTQKRALARVEFGFDEKSGEMKYFVQDNGAGFDMSYADKLFGAFQRLHGQSEFPGIGIGLATVQRIVNRHGGRVWAIAAPDEGATVYFTLGRGGANGGQENRAARGGQPGRRGPDAAGAEEEQHPQ